MSNIFLRKEFKVTAENKPGVMARLTAPMAESGIGVFAWCGWSENNKAYFMFITNDHDKTSFLLSSAGYKFEERDVIVVETVNETGSLFKVAQKLASAGINIDYNYATCDPKGGDTWIVFHTDDVKEAIEVLHTADL